MESSQGSEGGGRKRRFRVPLAPPSAPSTPTASQTEDLITAEKADRPSKIATALPPLIRSIMNDDTDPDPDGEAFKKKMIKGFQQVSRVLPHDVVCGIAEELASDPNHTLLDVLNRCRQEIRNLSDLRASSSCSSSSA